ncbi:MAG: hypothetical protein MUF05_01225 [Candidatus Omnitrophica bacterium]|jgi:hypothetical protein|nr:hypothetical protein [Candidatus Omnitrophota bacterium]
MIAIISSVIVIISSIVVTLVSFNPNFHSMMENDFKRSAFNNAYLYSWEIAQLKVRSGQLTNTKTKINDLPLGYLTKKGGTEVQKFKTDITLKPADGSLTIIVEEDN